MSEDVQLELIPEGELQICQFYDKQIRKILHNDEWFFSIVDVIEAVTLSDRPRKYWSDLKTKLVDNEGFKELSEKVGQLKMPSADGKMYETDCGNTETLFRIIQSIPSPKAEPFKRWLAKVGYERIQETQNPAIAIKRAIVDYQLQGRSTEWIDSRLRTILSRKELTDEWQKRGIKEGFEYGLLTDVISKHTFGKTTKEYRDHKNLSKNHSLRDNMSDIELILTMLGETSTRKIAQVKDAQGLEQNKEAAKAGGDIAGNARTDLEAKLGKSIVTSQNHLKQAPPSKHLLDFPGTFQEKIRAIAAVPAKPKKGLPDDQR